MKILVTGATGFIGKYVISELLKFKKHLIVATGIEPKEEINMLGWTENVEYINCDLNELKQNFFSFFKEPDLLIHLAWQGLPNYKDPSQIERNIPTNYNFIKNMIENGLKDLSVIGTCLEYGLIEGSLSEEIPTNPIVPYGIAKDILRKKIEKLNKKYDFNFKWIRLFYMYGSGQNTKSILSQLDKALDNNDEVFHMSGGEQLRDYLPVEKVSEYIIKVSLQNKIKGIINCCSGKPITIKDLVDNHIKKRGKKINLNFGYYSYTDYEPMAFWGDNSKLRRILED